jgi:hypothetical protein
MHGKLLLQGTAMLSLLALTGCSTTLLRTSSPEHLVMDGPRPVAEWNASQGVWEDAPAVEFAHRSTGDTVVGAMLQQARGISPEVFRATVEQGSDACDTYASHVVDETPAGPYPRLIWLTECRREGSWRTRLHVYIRGTEAGYYAFKLWQDRPDAAGVREATEYLRSLVVCDERPARKAPCPAPPPGAKVVEVKE